MAEALLTPSSIRLTIFDACMPKPSDRWVENRRLGALDLGFAGNSQANRFRLCDVILVATQAQLYQSQPNLDSLIIGTC